MPGTVEINIPWINSETVIFEAAYYPEITPLRQQISKAGGIIITGRDMYVKMAQVQFKLFTGRNISSKTIKKYLIFE